VLYVAIGSLRLLARGSYFPAAPQPAVQAS